MQFSTTVRNSWLDDFVAEVGATAKMKFFGNPLPTNCAAADDSELRATLTLPSTWLNTASNGQATKAGTWSGTASATGPIQHARLYNNGLTTCHWQGLVTQAYRATTNDTTGTNGNTLHFADTTAITVGDSVDGTGIPIGSVVLAKTSTTVTIDRACPDGVSSGTEVVFGDVSGDMTLDNVVVSTIGQTISVATWTLVAPGA